MFEDLEAWQQARHLVNEIYSLTRENSSLSKDFGLTDQVQGLLYQSCRTSLKGLNGRISRENSVLQHCAWFNGRSALAALRNFRQLPTISTGSRTSERHRNLSWEARLRPFAVDRGTERQTPTSTVALIAPPSMLYRKFPLFFNEHCH